MSEYGLLLARAFPRKDGIVDSVLIGENMGSVSWHIFVK